jgi:hypothetical protein
LEDVESKATTYSYTSTQANTDKTVSDESEIIVKQPVVETNTNNTSKVIVAETGSDNEVPNQGTLIHSGEDGTVFVAATNTSDDNDNEVSNSVATLETRAEIMATDNNMEDAVGNSCI